MYLKVWILEPALFDRVAHRVDRQIPDSVELSRLRLDTWCRSEQAEGPGQPGSPVHYRMTSSARASTAGGIVNPSALAVFRLMTSSYFVGCSTGRSAGLAPLRILST